MSVSSNASMIEKIKKLLAMSKDASVTEEEAMAFMNKAQLLLAAHNLDMSMVTEEAQEADMATMDKTIYETSYGHIKWRQTLMGAVAKLFFCKGYINTSTEYGKTGNLKRVAKFVFVGKEHNRAIAISMFEYLEKTVVRLSRKFSSDATQRYHFEQGCGLRLTRRVYDKIEAVVVGITPAGEKSNLPALYSTELALVEEFLGDMDWAKKRKQRAIALNSASMAGHHAANTISLDNQLGGGSRSSGNLPAANKFLLK